MDTTTLMKEGPRTEIPDPHAVPYPEGPVWDRLGHELVYGRGPEEVAKEYGEDVREVERLSRLFWDGFERSVWLAEAEEYGLLDERLVTLANDELHAGLEDERRRWGCGAGRPTPPIPTTRKEALVNSNDAWDFARKEMLEEGENLKRAEPVGPFVVALVELGGGGYENRAAQPAVIHRNRNSRLPLVSAVETYGSSRYRAAARRFNSLVDEELA